MKPIYIFGHKSPDTDSICSAIALAYLKNKLGQNAIAKVIGPINRETKFVLDYFKVDAPSYLNDAKVEIKDISYTKRCYVNENDSIENAFNIMRKYDLTATALVDDKRMLKGYVTLKDMAKYLMGDNRNILNTNLKHLLTTLDAKIITNFQNDFLGEIKLAAFSSESFINDNPIDENTILIVGDRYKILEYAIEKKAKLIILTGENIVPKNLLNKAVSNKVNIITSKYKTFDVAGRISLANFISMINSSPKPLTIDVHSFYTDFLSLTKKYNYTNYPVVKKSGECVGILKLTDAANYEKKKVILVDHNNYEQSIDGLNEADILEVYDHHNIGNIGTNYPIYFTSRPVGCTATVVYDSYKKNGVKVPKDMAGLLLSAILSDTLLFTSPTVTQEDKLSAMALSKIAKVDLDKYGIEMLSAASSIKGLSVSELINQDFKRYNVNDKIYGIAVITTLEFAEIASKMSEYIDKLNEMTKNEYAGVLIFVTDVIKNGSYVLYNDKSFDLVASAFNISNLGEGYFLKGIVSRKKQILPALLKELEK